MRRFFDRKDHSLAVRQSRHWQMIMRKIELPRWRKIAKSWGFSAPKILLTSSALIPMKKGLFTHAMHSQNSRTLSLRQIFICEAILLGLGHVTRVDPLGHPCKFGKNPPRGMEVTNFQSSPL